MDDTKLTKLLGSAERVIQATLLSLEEALEGSGWRVDHVNVDTRNFGNMKPEILVSKTHQ